MTVDLQRLIDPDRLVARTRELIRLPSVNPFDGPPDTTTGERAVVDYLADHLDRLGYQPSVSGAVPSISGAVPSISGAVPSPADAHPGRPNLVGLSPIGSDTASAGPVLCLAGHTDTVGISGYDDPFGGVVDKGRIHGRGACDMKGALAAFIEVAEVLAESGQRLSGRLMIAGVADEEHGMLGSRALGAGGPVADQVIVGEPTGLRICTSHKGQYAFTIRTFGRAVHSSIESQGVNAIEHMTEIITMLGDYRVDLAAAVPHPMCGVATVNPGVIRGGDIASTVPDFCELEVDRRLVPGESTADLVSDIRRRIEHLADGRPEFRWELGPPSIDAAPLDTATSEPVVAAAAAALAARSLPSEPESFTGATDGPNLGAPAIIWGPGSLAQAHTTDEWLPIDELVMSARLYLDVTLRLLA